MTTVVVEGVLGDSGGPVFRNGHLVAVTGFGYTANCCYLGGCRRVDMDVVQDWLEPHLRQPPLRVRLSREPAGHLRAELVGQRW